MKLIVKNHIVLLQLFTIIIILGCSEKPSNVLIGSQESTIFSVNSKSLTIEDTLRINLPKYRPSNISIQSPNGQWYIVHSKENNIYIIPNNEINTSQYININLSSLQGLTWIDGIQSKQHVFKEMGEYTIYMADNLETDPDNTFNFKVNIFLK